ncbi:MAG: hypothetical protein QM777_16165 [Pseudorhodoferax sp.]
MKQMRIASTESLATGNGARFTSEWMHTSLMNQWLLKVRLKEARDTYGLESHWVEMRDKPAEREPPAGIWTRCVAQAMPEGSDVPRPDGASAMPGHTPWEGR